MMDIICDSCGKKYRVDETKMKGESATEARPVR
jgi:hypothetical protein